MSSPTDVTPERLTAWQRLRRPRHAVGETPAEAPLLRRQQAQAGRLVRGVLRHLSLLDALLARGEFIDFRRTHRDVLWILRLAAYEKMFQSSIPDYAIGNQAVALARHGTGPRTAGFVNATLRRLLPTLPDSPQAVADDPWIAALPPETRWSIPRPILDCLTEGYGAEIIRNMLPVLSETEAPVWLRVNTLRATPEAVRAALTAEEITTDTSAALLPEALLWRGSERLPWESAPWQRGELTVQDLGAMLAAALLDPRPGQSVLDACAAPGGKTGHLWQRMAGEGRLVALEVDPDRRREMASALVRLFGPGHPIEIPDCPDLTDLPPGPGFDRLLLDVPCMALGLIGRHPEIRWDGRLREIERVTARQRALLEAGAARVLPGGRLLWVTCSPTLAENEAIVGPWLASHPDWRMVDPFAVLGREGVEWFCVRDGWVRTRPDRIPCDGFTLALLEHVQAS